MRRLLITAVASLAVLLPIAPSVAATRLPPPPPSRSFPAAIEGFAPYQPQFLCIQRVEPGVAAFEHLLLTTYPATTSLGDLRPCSVGGTSEHYDGRAFDWGADHRIPAQRAAGESLLNWLFATDADGNALAMFRRLGLMYVIWNKRIWGSWDQRWEPYPCFGVTDCHVNHIHFSFGWAGAREKTSFWTGTVSGVMEPPLPKLAVGASKRLVVTASAASATAHWLLSRNATYRLTARGLWHAGGVAADAVCSHTDQGWQPRRSGLQLSGDQLQLWGESWQPVDDDGSGCDTVTHAYRLDLRTPSSSTVSVDLAGAGKNSDSGDVVVRIVRLS
ncbi:MAG TPA: hypothetical protein VG899_01645 [Mycobacteriales bacterium]|nr:hypothetical protein [Mycobacteriales bacterium]